MKQNAEHRVGSFAPPAGAADAGRPPPEVEDAVLSGLPHPVLVLDRDGRILACSAAAAALFGYDSQALVGEPLSLLFTGPDGRIPAELAGALADGRAELEGRRANGAVLPVALVLSALADGRRWVACLTDRSGEAAAREEIARLRRKMHALTNRLVRAIEEERKKLARELHDELGQSLTAIKTDAILISNGTPRVDRETHDSAQRILSVISRIYEVVYSMMRRLRPTALDDLGLEAAIESLIAEWRRRHASIPCELHIDGDLARLGEDVDMTVYRMIQECLTNVARYSAAAHVRVSIRRECVADAEQLRIEVCDDGLGLDATQTPVTRERFGLWGLTERVEALHGELGLESAPGQGLRVTVVLPLGTLSQAGS